MSTKNNLDQNKIDLIASVAKSAVGVVPLAGTLLSELVGTIIPNQRIDRLTKYVKELEQKMSQIPDKLIEDLKNNEQVIDLIEEGFVQASRAITDERRKYITSIVKNGITDDSIGYEESKYLLKFLQELNDIEIIWLRFFKDSTDHEFKIKHNNILSSISATFESDKETLQKVAFRDSYREHLERLGLIRKHVEIDLETRLPKIFDSSSGLSNSCTTSLGDMLLEQIGLTDTDKN